MGNQLETILKELIERPSTTNNITSSTEIIDYVYNLLTSVKVAYVKKGAINSFSYLIATTQQPNDRMIWFIGHLDVVPADESMFQLTSDDKNYYGRGVFDMKGMAAAILAAFINLPELEKANVGLMFTTDEEIGGRNGVGALVKDFKGAAAFVLDGSTDFVLQEKIKGILWLEIVAKGVATHGSRPWLGQSANEELVDYLHQFKAWYKANMPQKAPHNYFTTFNLGKIVGGKATNQVSDEAIASIDIRFVSEEDASKMLEAANSIAKKCRNITVNVLLKDPAIILDVDSPWCKRTIELINTLGITPGDDTHRYAHGSNDGRYLVPLNIPIIVTRPAGGNQHAEGEWVSKEGLAKLEQLCAILMEETKS